MADITMCADGRHRCALASHCWRVQAKPNPRWQSFSNFYAAKEAAGDECPDYWPMRDADRATDSPKDSTTGD